MADFSFCSVCDQPVTKENGKMYRMWGDTNNGYVGITLSLHNKCKRYFFSQKEVA